MAATERPDDPAPAAVCGELARLFIAHKADLGIAHFSDADIIAGVDRLMEFRLERPCRALIVGDSAWLPRFAWFGQACDRLQADQRAVKLDG